MGELRRAGKKREKRKEKRNRKEMAEAGYDRAQDGKTLNSTS